MSKIFKKIVFVFVLGFVMFFIFSGNTYATSEVDVIAERMKVNASTEGKYFKVGMMSNYYQVERYNADVTIYRNVSIAKISDTIASSDIEDNFIQRTYIANDSTIVGFNGPVPRGYGKTLLYGLGYDWAYDDSGDNSESNYDGIFSNGNGFALHFSTPEIVENTQKYKLVTDEYLEYNYVRLELIADVVTADVTIRQYQKWWWGPQNLWEANVTAYIFCNIREEVHYSQDILY